MKGNIALKMPFNLIQKIRLAQALSESDYNLVINPDDEFKFSLLKEQFGMHYITEGENAHDLQQFCKIDHQTPCTEFGSLSRPLIFPAEIVE
jgi:hypothetical protein